MTVALHITYQALIAKMESELNKAKEAHNHEEMRGYLFAVKALAELTLETGKEIRKEQPHDELTSKNLSPSIGKHYENHDVDDSIFDF